MPLCRSREGAWIEILYLAFFVKTWGSRSREGAWIEMPLLKPENPWTETVAPARERGLKYENVAGISVDYQVAPVRERGLKYYRYVYMKQAVKSLP